MRALFAALSFCFCVAANAQFEAPVPNEWPKAPGDWIEFAPGMTEQDYMYLGYYWMGRNMGGDRPLPKPNKGFDLKQPIPKWMSGLKRPDLPESSCCGPADAYEVEILKDGGPTGEWIAEITHGEPRQYPDGTQRPPMPNGTKFHIVAQHVTKPDQGNPSWTAWLFTVVGLRTVTVYCLVPLPPSQ